MFASHLLCLGGGAGRRHLLLSLSEQYDYMERLDGKEKWSVVESPRERRSVQTVVLNEAVFVQHLDPGSWHLAFYNDGKDREIVSFNTAVLGQSSGHASFSAPLAVLTSAAAKLFASPQLPLRCFLNITKFAFLRLADAFL
ncbi:hypothetical protein Z043_119980 [Scleropages formosus]|uniref:Teneurin-1-4-like galactose-binding domain-containing protein n=1 Tax=Scleropages formosus TaxID=113540 RepID=A0A0P7TLR8_SCLFO|nr:hypothetical protein Z043_119980 [Scleropages formosus]